MRTRLRSGEDVMTVARRHWIVLGGPVGLALFLLGCVVAAIFVDRPWFLPVAGALFVVSALWAFWRWLSWRCDLWVVTSHRVIDESGVLGVRVVDSPLDTIHNVTCVRSIMGRIFNYGMVNIQTAAEEGSTTIPTAWAPDELRETILEFKERYSRGATATRESSAETKECLYCAETIKARATVCRFCGRTLQRSGYDDAPRGAGGRGVGS